MNGMAAINSISLSKLQSLNGVFAIYKKSGPTSADVLNTLKQALLKGRQSSLLMERAVVLYLTHGVYAFLHACERSILYCVDSVSVFSHQRPV